MSDMSVEEELKRRVAIEGLRHDLSQIQASKRLSRLQRALHGYDNEPLVSRQTGNIANCDDELLPSEDERTTWEKVKIPRGLYLYGEVGTGKSMLMDIFFRRTLADVNSRSRRCHFHSFMADIHLRIHELKKKDLKEKGRNFSLDLSRQSNPVVRVAQQLASECLLLCLDELQITDIADAMIISQLFEELWACGTVLVATSNRSPQDLYEGGLNREYFLPFINLLERHCLIHEMNSNVDYRKLMVSTASKNMCSFKNYFISPESSVFGDDANVADDLFGELVSGREFRSMSLDVGMFGRKVLVERADPGGLVARFSFQELCERNDGAMDYRAIAEQFSILFVEDVPTLRLENPSQHDCARRFITFIDEAYEARCALVCFTDSPVKSPFDLLVTNDVDFNLLSDSNAASVRELAFAFRRAASRITEMCSQLWWDKEVFDGLCNRVKHAQTRTM